MSDSDQTLLPADLPVAAGSALPKHALLARVLEQDLARGKYLVGTTLPSEPDLVQQFGVSRHTVRTALRTLQLRGLISSHQGLGSVVIATSASQPYTQGFASAEDLLQYVASTRIVDVQRTEITVDGTLADWLGCRPGERWWRLVIVRCPLDSEHPSTLADVYLPYAYGALLVALPGSRRPIFRAIEEQFGETITEIRQEISAAMPTPSEAEALQTPLGEPVLVIVRRYLGRHGQVLEATRTLHHAGQFTYAMNVRLTPARRAD